LTPGAQSSIFTPGAQSSIFTLNTLEGVGILIAPLPVKKIICTSEFLENTKYHAYLMDGLTKCTLSMEDLGKKLLMAGFRPDKKE
jgi:hypothetical protein